MLWILSSFYGFAFSKGQKTATGPVKGQPERSFAFNELIHFSVRDQRVETEAIRQEQKERHEKKLNQSNNLISSILISKWSRSVLSNKTKPAAVEF